MKYIPQIWKGLIEEIIQHWAKQRSAQILSNPYLNNHFLLVTTRGVVHLYKYYGKKGYNGREDIISSAAAPCPGNI